jgi:hypothetical protein
MPRKEPKPKRLSGTIDDLPFRDAGIEDEKSNLKAGAAPTTHEIASPRDTASGQRTGKRR